MLQDAADAPDDAAALAVFEAAATPAPALRSAADFADAPQPEPILWRDSGPTKRTGEPDAVLSVGECAILASAGGFGKSTLTLELATAAVTADLSEPSGARLPCPALTGTHRFRQNRHEGRAGLRASSPALRSPKYAWLGFKGSPMNDQKYQVALSFAGEERAYVEEVARHLQDRSIAVFYDGFATVELWGRSGTEAFDDAFGRQSAYVVMFISAAYVSKAWPRHERRSALSRMIQEQHEYILPVRFDDSCVPGLPADILYCRARDHTPAQLAGKIASKLGIKPFDGKASQVPPPRMTSPTGEVVFDYSSHNGRYIIGSGMLEFETKWTKASDTSIYVYNDPPSINGVALAQGCESISQVESAESLDYTSRTRTPSLGQIVVLRNTEGFYAAVHVIEIKDNSRHDDRDELRFRYAIQSDGSDNFTEFPITADADSISGHGSLSEAEGEVGPKPRG